MSTWAEALRFYETLVGEGGQSVQPMLDLVRFIATSPHAKHLSAAASAAFLRIGRVPRSTPGSQEIRITFDAGSQSFTFIYMQRPDESDPWSRSCAADEGRATFERLLHKRLRWFHEG